MPETYTIPTSFPEIKTVITKFGSLPNFYNYLTWITTHIFPKWLIRRNQTVEFLSYLSYWMTNFTNMFSGIGVAISCEVTGQKDGQSLTYCVDFIYIQTAIAAGCGTGSIAQLLLEDKLHQPGVLPVEKALPTDLFLQSISSRGLKINTHWLAT
jgi:saccharopine dehydrogenase-like NADP-dependent oxidoreductase